MRAVAEGVNEAGGYIEIVKKMQRDGYLTKSEGQEVYRRIKGKLDKEHEEVSSGLEHLARAAVWLFMAVGAILILVSGFSFTGAVVGSAFSVSWLFFIGLVLFVIGLVLRFRK